jgi:hypothetical protein
VVIVAAAATTTTGATHRAMASATEEITPEI